MKYCEKCGNELLDEAVVCPKCGCAVKQATKQQIEKKKNTTKGILLIVAGVAIAVIFIAFVISCL